MPGAQLLEYIKADNSEGVKELVAKCTPEEKAALFKAEPVSKETPLHVAVALKNGNMVSVLLQLGHPVDVLNADGWSPLHAALMRRCSQDVLMPFLNLSTAVLNYPAAHEVYQGYTPLHCAAFQKDEIATAMLLRAGAKPSIVAAQQESPLHLAAEVFTQLLYGFIYCLRIPVSRPHSASLAAGSCVEILLKADAPVNAPNKLGVTPLMEACAKERLNSVELLVKASGINIAQVDVNGDSALHHAFNVQLQKLFGENWPVREDAQRIAYVLVCSGAPTDLKNKDGTVPLKYASPSFAVILKMVSNNPKLAEAVPTLDHAMDPAVILSGILEDKDTKAFCGAAAILKHEQAQLTAEENAKGACPFVNARKPKTHPIHEDGSESDDSEMEDRVKNATKEEISACPFLQSKHSKPKATPAASGGSCPSIVN